VDTIADTTGHDAFGFVHVEFEGTLDVADTALNFNSLDIDGNYLYAVGDSIFATISILDPLAPVCSSEYVIPGINNLILEDVEVRGNFAFLVGGIITPGGGSDGILIVLNIGKPKEPTYVSSFIKRGTPTENHYFTAIDLEGNVAYVVDSFSNFYSIDITNYTTMSEIGNVAIDPGGHDLMVDGNWAYIACSHSIVSVNVTTPGTLVVGDADTIGYVGDLYVDGDWLYVVCGDGTGYGLWKYDITDPTSITYYSSDYWYDCAIPYGVSIMGDWGYIMGYRFVNSPTEPDTFSTIGVFDVTDNVKFVCDFNFMRQLMRRLHKNGETMLYTVGRYFDGSGFVGAARAIRVGYPDSCVFSSDVLFHSILYSHLWGDVPVEPSQIEVRGDYAFVVDEKGMSIIDISNPLSPTYAGDFYNGRTDRFFHGIAVSGNSAFLTSTGPDTSFWIISIKKPNPTPPWPLPIIGATRPDSHINIIGEVKVEGNIAYTFGIDRIDTNTTGILNSFNIQTLSSPTFLSLDKMHYAKDSANVDIWTFYNTYFGELQIEGDTAYVSWRDLPYTTVTIPSSFGIKETNHIAFFDLSDPTDVKSFVPFQIRPSNKNHRRNMGFYRKSNSPSDCGGSIDVEGNIIYSTIGITDHGLKPVGSPIPNNYGLFRYRIDTTYGGYIDEYDPTSSLYGTSPWIKKYKGLTIKGYPLELLIDGDYAFCSFNKDGVLYMLKVDSVDNYEPRWGFLLIYQCNFNDYKVAGDYLYAVGETLITPSTYESKFWSIKVYNRNHCTPSGMYFKSSYSKYSQKSTKNILACFPNPFNSELKIFVKESKNYNLSILTVNGKLVYQVENINKRHIAWKPNNNISSGLYIVEIETEKGKYYNKVLYLK